MVSSPPLTVSFTVDLKKSISNLSHVTLTITKELLITEGKEKNMVDSPLSIQVVLFLITTGCNGPTKDQLLLSKSNSSNELNTLASLLAPLVLSLWTRQMDPLEVVPRL
ncbi:hypothetical protein ACFX2J_028381 [Malus domestica]